MKINLHSPLAKKVDKIPILPTETSGVDIEDHDLPDKARFAQKMQFLSRDCQMMLTLICFCLIIFVFGCYFERGVAGRSGTHAFFRGTDGVKHILKKNDVDISSVWVYSVKYSARWVENVLFPTLNYK